MIWGYKIFFVSLDDKEMIASRKRNESVLISMETVSVLREEKTVAVD